MYVRSQTQQCIFALLVTNFNHYGHHLVNIAQTFKKCRLHVVHIMLRYMESHFVGPVAQSV